MSNTKHTPTPWHAVENSWSHTGIYAGHKEVAGLDIYDEATEENQEDHEALMAANAAFIVRAVNSHEQLVAALRFYANAKDWEDFSFDEMGAYCDRNEGSKLGNDFGEIARAALAAAEAA